MPVSSLSLVTLSEIKLYQDVPDSYTEDDEKLEFLADAVTYAVEDWCSNIFVQRQVVEEHTGAANHWHKGGQKRIKLRKYPIVSVISIADVDSDTVSSDDYNIDSVRGYLEHDWYWPVPEYAWTITYIAGRYADTAAVDPNLKQAALLWIGDAYNRPDPAVRRIGAGDAAITYRDSTKTAMDALVPPNDVTLLLSPFVSREV